MLSIAHRPTNLRIAKPFGTARFMSIAPVTIPHHPGGLQNLKKKKKKKEEKIVLLALHWLFPAKGRGKRLTFKTFLLRSCDGEKGLRLEFYYALVHAVGFSAQVRDIILLTSTIIMSTVFPEKKINLVSWLVLYLLICDWHLRSWILARVQFIHSREIFILLPPPGPCRALRDDPPDRPINPVKGPDNSKREAHIRMG